MKKRDTIKIWIFTLLYIGFFLLRPMAILFVHGESMMPNVHDQDVLLGIKAISIKRGDVVAADAGSFVIKRVVGLPGETIECKDGVILIDGYALSEEYLEYDRNQIYTDWDPVVLGEKEYFIMGDNRDNSYDSRFYGPIERDRIQYKALLFRSTD